MHLEKIAGANVKVELASNRITFLDSRYYMTEDAFVPSVTTILEAYPKGAAYFQWLKANGEDADTIRDEAGRRGSIVHALTEAYDDGEEVSLYGEDRINFKISEWAMFERYVEFRSRFPFDIIHSEQNFISPALGFAGTVDRVIEFEGKTILLDIKTSNAIYPSYWLQLAAYEQLLTESYGFNPIDEVAILWLNAKTRTEGKKGDVQGAGWQMIRKVDTTKDWELFQATHKLWLAENEGARPRQLSYTIKHKL
jgi:hypothetical protein